MFKLSFLNLRNILMALQLSFIATFTLFIFFSQFLNVRYFYSLEYLIVFIFYKKKNFYIYFLIILFLELIIEFISFLPLNLSSIYFNLNVIKDYIFFNFVNILIFILSIITIIFLIKIFCNLKIIYISGINFLILIFLLSFFSIEKIKTYVYAFDKNYLNSNINYYSNNKNKIFRYFLYYFIIFKYQSNYENLESFEQEFNYDLIYNFKKYEKIIVVILESAPLFKNNELNNYLFEPIFNNRNNISKFHRISDLNLSTIGAEASFVCNQSKINYSNIIDRPTLELEKFYSNCEILKYFEDNNFLVNYFHGFDASFYSRDYRYKKFDNVFFLEDILKIKPSILYSKASGFSGIDDIEMIKFSFKEIDKLRNSYNIITTLGTHDEFIYYDKLYCDSSKDRILRKDIFICKMITTFRQILTQIMYEFSNLNNGNNLLIITSDHPPKNLIRKYKNLINRDKVPLLIISND